MIFFHELGHFLAAKYFGVCVKTFSIGFGKQIFSKKIGETTYALSAIPLGGYVSMKGQEDLKPNEKSEDKDSYNVLHPWKRIIILAAGSLFNILLAFLIYVSLGYIGVDKLLPVVGKTMEGSPAALALQEGDKILSINGKKIITWNDISKNVKVQESHLELLRKDKLIKVTLTPKVLERTTIFGEKTYLPTLGILPSGDFAKIYHRGFSSFTFAFQETLEASKLIYTGLGKLITGVVPAKEMGGIIAMTDLTSKAAKADFSVFLMIVALISVNLGLVNLLPIPVLDGGHIFLTLYELIRGKELSEKTITKLSYFGMSLLATLFLFTVANDILRLLKFY